MPPKLSIAAAMGIVTVTSPNILVRLLISRNDRTKGYICAGGYFIARESRAETAPNAPALPSIPITAAIKIIMPHIVAMLSAPALTDSVNRLAENVTSAFSSDRGGIFRVKEVNRTPSRFAPATARKIYPLMPAISGATATATAEIYAGPGAMQKQSISSACFGVIFPSVSIWLISEAPMG